MSGNSFYFGFVGKNFFFNGVDIESTWGMVCLSLGFLFLTILLQGFEASHKFLLWTYNPAVSSRCSSENQPLIRRQAKSVLNVGTARSNYWPYKKPRSLLINRTCFHLLRTCVYTLTLTLHYFIMLAVMSFNAYLFIAAAIGAGFGYLLFGYFLQLEPGYADIQAKGEVDTPQNAEGCTGYGAVGTSEPTAMSSAVDGNSSSRCYFYVQDYESNIPTTEPQSTQNKTATCESVQIKAQVHV